MDKLIVFTEKEFNEKLLEFVKNFINFSNKDFGCSLTDNETGDLIIDEKEIAGNLLIPWSDTFDIHPKKYCSCCEIETTALTTIAGRKEPVCQKCLPPGEGE